MLSDVRALESLVVHCATTLGEMILGSDRAAQRGLDAIRRLAMDVESIKKSTARPAVAEADYVECPPEVPGIT